MLLRVVLNYEKHTRVFLFILTTCKLVGLFAIRSINAISKIYVVKDFIRKLAFLTECKI